jgi:hypothetical protein
MTFRPRTAIISAVAIAAALSAPRANGDAACQDELAAVQNYKSGVSAAADQVRAAAATADLWQQQVNDLAMHVGSVIAQLEAKKHPTLETELNREGYDILFRDIPYAESQVEKAAQAGANALAASAIYKMALANAQQAYSQCLSAAAAAPAPATDAATLTNIGAAQLIKDVESLAKELLGNNGQTGPTADNSPNTITPNPEQYSVPAGPSLPPNKQTPTSTNTTTATAPPASTPPPPPSPIAVTTTPTPPTTPAATTPAPAKPDCAQQGSACMAAQASYAKAANMIFNLNGAYDLPLPCVAGYSASLETALTTPQQRQLLQQWANAREAYLKCSTSTTASNPTPSAPPPPATPTATPPASSPTAGLCPFTVCMYSTPTRDGLWEPPVNGKCLPVMCEYYQEGSGIDFLFDPSTPHPALLPKDGKCPAASQAKLVYKPGDYPSLKDAYYTTGTCKLADATDTPPAPSASAGSSPSPVQACDSKPPFLPWGGQGSATITVSGGKPCGIGWHDTPGGPGGVTVLDSMSVTSPPSHGSLKPQDQHVMIFTPAAGYKGPDSFTLSMQEHNGGRTATMSVNVSVTIQ